MTFSTWQARLDLGFEQRQQRTVLNQRRHYGPLTVQRPFYPEGDVCHVYILHPPDGIAGGDELTINVRAATNAHALLTSPSAAKFYRSETAHAQQYQNLMVEENAYLEWLPQENIFFAGAQAQLSFSVNLHPTARFIGWDSHCLGRPVINEQFHQGNLLLKSHIQQNDRPLLIERLSITPTDLTRPAGLNQNAIFATLYATPANEQVIEIARHSLTPEQQAHCGITLVDGLLIARYLGQNTAKAKTCLQQIWQAIRPLVIQRPACIPRIWLT
jgi:urease accessory protein